MSLAKPRWKIEESTPCPHRGSDATIKALFTTNKGEEFSVIAHPEVIDQLIALPCDYIDLGNVAADLEHGEQKARGIIRELVAENRVLNQRIDAAGDEAIVPILADDLEKALNIAIRWASALGIQENPDPDSLYGQLQTLAHKYKMNYTPPKSYNYREMLLPLDRKEGVMRELNQDESYIQVTDIIDNPDDPFIYRLTTTSGVDEVEVLDAPLTEEEYEGSFLVRYDPNEGILEFTNVKSPADDIEGFATPVSRYELERNNDPESRGWLIEDDDGDPS